MLRREKENHVLHDLCLEKECFILPVESLISVVTGLATEPAIVWARIESCAVRQLDSTDFILFPL